MDANSSQNEELYRAAVGESKADYYVPLFTRFDEGGSRASWNWPALFVPFFWMLYRRMYGIALAYFFAFPFAAGIVIAILSAMLGETVGVLTYWAIVIAVRVLIAVFANAFYHNYIRSRIDAGVGRAPSHEVLVQRLSKSSGGSVAAVAIAGVGVVFCVGILAAIAVPAYQDYAIRSQVMEGINLAAPVKASVANAYTGAGDWPSDLEGLGEQESARYVSSIEVSDGTILIRYGKAAHSSIAGHTLSLHPADVQGGVEWACGYAAGNAAQTDIARRYLPSACRGDLQRL